jgi:hypothetical protein
VLVLKILVALVVIPILIGSCMGGTDAPEKPDPDP